MADNGTADSKIIGIFYYGADKPYQGSIEVDCAIPLFKLLRKHKNFEYNNSGFMAMASVLAGLNEKVIKIYKGNLLVLNTMEIQALFAFPKDLMDYAPFEKLHIFLGTEYRDN